MVAGILSKLLTLGGLLAGLAAASPTSSPASQMQEFKSQVQSDVNLRFVKDSGVCETTPGVGQMSGYVDIGTNMSMVSRCQPVAVDVGKRRSSVTCRTSGSGSSKPGTTPKRLRSLSGKNEDQFDYLDPIQRI